VFPPQAAQPVGKGWGLPVHARTARALVSVTLPAAAPIVPVLLVCIAIVVGPRCFWQICALAVLGQC